MAMFTEGKINEMLGKGKADQTVATEYTHLDITHKLAKVEWKAKKQELKNAKDTVKLKSAIMHNISLLHPIKKYRAFKEVREAKKRHKLAKDNLKMAKIKLKSAQIELREMRKEAKEQYKSYKENEKMNKRVNEIRNGRYTSLSIQASQEYNKTAGLRDSSVYHIDKKNPLNNARIIGPSKELYSEVNKAYAKHLRGKAADRLAKMKDEVDKTISKAVNKTMNTAHQVLKSTRSNQEEYGH